MHRSPLFWIILAALAIRCGSAFWLQHDLDVVKKRPFLIEGDAQGYWDLGLRIADRQPYEIYRRYVLRMPGYPAFVAGAINLSRMLGIADRDHLVARLLMAAVGTLTCGLVAVLGKMLFDAPTGTLAAAITAIAPPLVGFSVILLSETLFAATLVVSLLCIAKLVSCAAREQPLLQQCKWAALTGVTIGLAVYVRPSWLLAAPCIAGFFAAWLIWQRSIWKGVAVAGIIVACAYGSLLPWAYRNDVVTGHWIWTTLWVGPSLYDGLNPQANGESNMEFFEHDRLMNQMSEHEVDRYYREKSWQFVRDNPGQTLALTFDKLRRFWMPWPNAKQFSNLTVKFAIAAYFLPVLAGAIIGWIWGPRNPWAWILTLGPILYFSCVHAIFLGSLRYRLPAEYPLCIAAAVGFRHIWIRLTGRIQPST
jgi:4-amino-4-deoxy-L-arabinose transferase-like glycosyltransferase